MRWPGIVLGVWAVSTGPAAAGDLDALEAYVDLAHMAIDARELCKLRQADDRDECIGNQGAAAAHSAPLIRDIGLAGDSYSLIPECLKRGAGVHTDWEDVLDCLRSRIAETHALDYFRAHPEAFKHPKAK